MTGIGKLGVLEEFFEQKIWFLDMGNSRRIVGVTIKVEPQGYLAVVKTISPEGPEVAFVGSGTLDTIRRKLQSPDYCNKLAWREDQYKLDKK